MDETRKKMQDIIHFDWERIGSTTEFINSIRAVLRKKLEGDPEEEANDDVVEVITTVHSISDLEKFIKRRPDLNLEIEEVLDAAKEDYKHIQEFDDQVKPTKTPLGGHEDSDNDETPTVTKPWIN